MTEPRRYAKYPRKQKLAAVMATEMSGIVQASKQTGIPASTIEYWLHKPEFAEFRNRTREDLAEEVKAVAHAAWKRVAETMSVMEPRDALFAADKASTILQLLTGSATSRTETRDISDSLSDADLIAIVREADAITSAGSAPHPIESTPEG